MTLRPCGQVCTRLLRLALRVAAAAAVVRRPAGVALLREAHPSSSYASAHHASVTERITAAVTSCGIAHGEMIEAGPGPRACPRGVHGWLQRTWRAAAAVVEKSARDSKERNLLRRTASQSRLKRVSTENVLNPIVLSNAFEMCGFDKSVDKFTTKK